MNEYAKDLYLQIIRIVKAKEKRIKPTQEIKVTLLHYPDMEINEIGRLGSEYLFFSWQTSESPDTTLLLPAEPLPIRIDVVNSSDSSPAKSKKRIGFCGDISDNE